MLGREPILRVATRADIPTLGSLMAASIAAIFPAYYDAEQTASAVEHIGRPDPILIEDGTYFVLDVDGEIVGCGGWSRRGKVYVGSAPGPDDDRLLDPAREAAHVRAMFVRPDWTRRGLGRRIIDACESAAARAGFSRLTLVATLPGVPLYAACGFLPDGEVEDIVLADGRTLPCLAMSKAIEVAAEVRASTSAPA
jgi:GNAT superfamily N-acetyltransferase